MSVKTWFEEAQSGDQAAFELLFGSSKGELEAFVRGRLSRELRRFIDVEDILQETSLKSLESLPRIQWQGQRALTSWFCGIALHVIYANSRRFLKMHVLPGSVDDEDPLVISPSRGLRREERFARLEQCLTRLTPEQQQVIRITRIEGRPIRQAAELMGRSEKATYQLLWRAIKRLRETFGDTGSLHLPPDRFLLRDGEHDQRHVE